MYNQERLFYNKNYSMNGDVQMSIRDRGIQKWQAALILPEHKEKKKGYFRQVKPILDEYQLEVFENKIHTAMEFVSPVKFIVWEEGFEGEYTGLIHRLDPITKMIYLELDKEKGYILKIKFDDIIGVD